ncbi:hypothetical protein K4F52_008604 [Lecanicillium sp. MT-2017a]|nr:hypothetical protein K4F52_008604 [Lecanicillium sp. MT-2017a]
MHLQSTTLTSLALALTATASGPCTMGIDVLDQTVAVVGGTHQQYCKASIWDQGDVSKNPVATADIGCSGGSTAQVLWGGWHYNFRLNKSVGPSGKLGDGDAEVMREYVGAEVPFNEHYSKTHFAPVNVAITNIAYAQVDCPFK